VATYAVRVSGVQKVDFALHLVDYWIAVEFEVVFEEMLMVLRWFSI
jgi:hypothetical protein